MTREDAAKALAAGVKRSKSGFVVITIEEAEALLEANATLDRALDAVLPLKKESGGSR